MEASVKGIGGGVGPSQRGAGHVTVLVEVDDLDATLKDAERLRGKKIAGPITFPDKWPSAGGPRVRELAYFADPEGRVIGLCQGIVRA